MKLLISSVTWHTPKDRVRDTIAHVTLNTINNVLKRMCLVSPILFVFLNTDSELFV